MSLKRIPPLQRCEEITVNGHTSESFHHFKSLLDLLQLITQVVDPDRLVAEPEQHVVKVDLNSGFLFIFFVSFVRLFSFVPITMRRYLEHHHLALEKYWVVQELPLKGY